MAPDPIVHLIDDDAAVCVALGLMLDAHDLPARTYNSAQEFLQAANADLGGCIVTDMRMPGMSGLELVAKLRERDILLPVVVITGHGDVSSAVRAMRAGVADFIEKPFEDGLLVNAVRDALKLQLSRSRQDEARLRFEKMLGLLSPRETDVLRGVLAGKINKVIAHDLGISVRTVEVYRANIMSKTRARGLSELVRLATIAGFDLQRHA